jgi:hypothetical protein
MPPTCTLVTPMQNNNNNNNSTNNNYGDNNITIMGAIPAQGNIVLYKHLVEEPLKKQTPHALPLNVT